MKLQAQNSLFRHEALGQRAAKLHGDVNLVIPVSWQAVGGLLFVVVATALVFLSLASYSRVETVGGIITPEGGVARIVPLRAGTVEILKVQTGAQVRPGDPLAIINTNENLAVGGASAVEILRSLQEHETELLRQEQEIAASANAGRAQLRTRISGLEEDVTGLTRQIEIQETLVGSARHELDLARKIAEKGFVSRRDILQREQIYMERQQQLIQLRQSRARQESAIRETSSAIQEANAAAGLQTAALAGQKSDIKQRRIGAEAARSYRLNAPIAGIATAVTAREGQAVSPQAPIMSIVPQHSELRAELYVPSSAIGFLEIGQKVAIGVDAFPYQRFGTIPAQIHSIASAPIAQADAAGNSVPVYIVTAHLARDRFNAFGLERPLIPGMTLTARITTEEQSLMTWLFEPLFAVGNR